VASAAGSRAQLKVLQRAVVQEVRVDNGDTVRPVLKILGNSIAARLSVEET
jgi:hypothetical protein